MNVGFHFIGHSTVVATDGYSPTCVFNASFTNCITLQELDSVSQEMDAVKHENEGLRLNIREVQTLQAIVDTKVKYSKRLFYLFWCTIPYLK